MATSITHNKNSTVTLVGEIPFEKLEIHRGAAIQDIGANIELPGFRKGHVPPKILTEHLGEGAILAEMAERTLHKELPSIFAEHALLPIGRPSVSITKLASGNPLGFKIEAAILPEILLPDTKEIAKKITREKPEEVTDGDLTRVVEEIRHRLYHAEHEHHDEGEKLPELTDELVRKLGDYKDLSDFKEKIRAELKTRKMYDARDKHRSAILDAILNEVPAVLPDILIESELDKMYAQFKGDVERVGMKFDNYLSQVKKTEEDLRGDWRKDAEKRAKSQLILNEIAKQFSIKLDEKEVNARVNEIIGEKPQTHRESVRIYVETILSNEKVFESLEQESVSNTQSQTT